MEDKGTLWLPVDASTMAGEIDSLFYFTYWVSIVIFAAVVLAMVYFVIKYRRRHANERTERVEENHLLELTWIVVPTILCMVVFTWGFQSFLKMSIAPPDAYEITVRGMKWNWEYEYPNGTISMNELRVPVDKPVRLVMSSSDVIHSLFIPAFRVKHDVLPNRYTSVWFEATKTGEYPLFCTEYCGTLHSGMLSKVFVLEPDEFDEWLESAGGSTDDLPLEEYGELLYTQQVCSACHSLDGSRIVGPSFQGLYDAQRQMDDGTTVAADDNYLRESILNPGARIVAGYQNQMPASYSSLSERQVSALIAFIREQQ
ncbi:MAG: cytochrome c oxidase subunit II [Rhodothermales bacterium]